MRFHPLLYACVWPALPLVTGCFDVSQTDPHVDGYRLEPNADGWVGTAFEAIGVQGAWYVYGDRYGDEKCQQGGHPVETCSEIFTPDPEVAAFPNTAGRMCTRGVVAVAPACIPGKPCSHPNEQRDFAHVWGAGIGLDFNAALQATAGGGSATQKSPWDPGAYGFLGVSFELDWLDEGGEPLELRVEFPIALPEGSEAPTTESHPKGSPYWGATSGYPPSPVKKGFNRFRWSDVKSPTKEGEPDHYTFDASRLLAIQFHVPSVSKLNGARQPYAFCVDELTLLRE